MSRWVVLGLGGAWVAAIAYTLHVLRDLAEHEDIDE